MRFAQVCVLAAVAVADEACEQREQVSMLQTKDRSSLTKEMDLVEAVNSVTQSFDSPEVGDFLSDVKRALANSNPTGSEALLQRASQGEVVKKLIKSFQSLSEENRQMLTREGSSILQKLPSPQKSALVQQVSHELDGSVGQKGTKTIEHGNGGKTTYTHTPNGRGGTHTVHTNDGRGNVATETTTRDKNGNLVHKHSHAHAGGQTLTNTQSANGGRLTHGHTHAHNEINGDHATITTEGGNVVHVNLVEVVDNVAHSFDDTPEVASFLSDVKIALANANPTGTEALLQRASQGEMVKKLIKSFQSLSEENRQKLTQEGSSILQKLPARKSALLQQVSRALSQQKDGVLEKSVVQKGDDDNDDGVSGKSGFGWDFGDDDGHQGGGHHGGGGHDNDNNDWGHGGHDDDDNNDGGHHGGGGHDDNFFGDD